MEECVHIGHIDTPASSKSKQVFLCKSKGITRKWRKW